MDTYNILEIGEIIRKVRKDRGLRLEDLADEHISPATVSNIERGVPHVRYDKVKYLIQKIGLDPNELPKLIESEKKKMDELRLLLDSIEARLDYADANDLLQTLYSLPIGDDHVYASTVHYLIGSCFAAQGKWKKAERSFTNAIRLAAMNPHQKHTNIEALAFKQLSIGCYFQNDLHQALQYINSAIDSFVDGNRQQLKYILYCNKARYLEKLGRIGEGLKVVNDLWHEIDNMNDRTALHFYEIRVHLLKRNHMYEEAIHYGRQGIEKAWSTGDSLSMCVLWTALGSTYLAKKDFKKAEICLKAALDFKGVSSNNIHLQALTKLSMVYIEQNDLNQAEVLLNQAEKIMQNTDPISSYFTLIVLGYFHKKQQDIQKATNYYQAALDLSRKFHLKNLEYKALFHLAQLKKESNQKEFTSYLQNMYEIAVSIEKSGEDDFSEIL